MEQADYPYAQTKLAQLKADYQVDILADWGDDGGNWRPGSWIKAELDRLENAICLMAGVMGGNEGFVRNLGGVTVRKADIGHHAGEALSHRVSFSTKRTFSAWTVVHEFGHAWDANHGWRLSRLLEKYTGGFTSPPLSLLKRLLRLSDSGVFNSEKKPGRYGRRAGCNQAGYFYGDRPSGSNWNFNRVEDFAESVAMYIGWERGNDLSDHAHKRITRYQLQNLVEDPLFHVIDNWTDYASCFYPENGDYTKTKRWQFVDDLLNGKLKIPG
ncbi:MAG: hypothetical protein EHM40_20220 [Chloroflexi bacterium]|nr:MAG: hypothetical protein EHM40_20220 [Chloroflexota bacterium]